MNTIKKKTRTLAALFVSLIVMTCALCQNAYAALDAFDVTVSSTYVSPGDEITVTVSIVTNESISDYSYNLNYDTSLLEYVSGGTLEYEGCVSYAGTGDPVTQEFTFAAVSEGTASIETVSTELLTADGEYIDLSSAYNSITIDSSAVTEAVESELTSDAETMTDTEDEVGTLTEADMNAPDDTLVSLHSKNATYYIIPRPSSVEAPAAYLPAQISLNDVTVNAYIKSSGDKTVLLYAANEQGHKGWYFFNTDEGTFLSADDILTDESALGSFMSEHQFVIMLIAIIILVILIIVIIMLAVSMKNLMADYEAEIERMKKSSKPPKAPAVEGRSARDTEKSRTEDVTEDVTEAAIEDDEAQSDVESSFAEIDAALEAAKKYKE